MHVEMIPCHEAPTNHPVIQEDGSVQCTLSEADAMGSDACERAGVADDLSGPSPGSSRHM